MRRRRAVTCHCAGRRRANADDKQREMSRARRIPQNNSIVIRLRLLLAFRTHEAGGREPAVARRRRERAQRLRRSVHACRARRAPPRRCVDVGVHVVAERDELLGASPRA